MKKAYIQPSVDVVNISGNDAVMLYISNTEVDTTTDQLGREEEDFGGPWDAEW